MPKSKQIENIVVDEANRRTYIVLAPRVLSDGETYRAIRREIFKRRGVPPGVGETLTINLTPGEYSSPLLVADRPQPMTGPTQASSHPGEST